MARLVLVNEQSTPQGEVEAEVPSTNSLPPPDDNDVTRFNEPIENFDEVQTIMELIDRVGNRQLLYDSEHPNHKSRHLVTKAWEQVADGLTIRGVPMTWKTCRTKWRNLRIYYSRVKKDKKGKSGDGRQNVKPWIYFAVVDAVMSRCATENENTTSNLSDDEADDTNEPDQLNVLNQKTDERNDNHDSLVETPRSSAPKPFRKRKAQEDDETNKLIDLLKNSGKDEDEFFHFGMNLAEKLRKLVPQKAALAQMKITTLMYEIEFSE